MPVPSALVLCVSRLPCTALFSSLHCGNPNRERKTLESSHRAYTTALHAMWGRTGVRLKVTVSPVWQERCVKEQGM